MGKSLPKLYFGVIIAYDRNSGDLNLALVFCSTAYRTRKAAERDLFAQRYDVLDPEQYYKHELWEVDSYNVNEVRAAFGSDLTGSDDDDDDGHDDEPIAPAPEDHGVPRVFEDAINSIGDINWKA